MILKVILKFITSRQQWLKKKTEYKTFLYPEFYWEKLKREEAIDNLSTWKEHPAKVQLIGCYGNKSFLDDRFHWLEHAKYTVKQIKWLFLNDNVNDNVFITYILIYILYLTKVNSPTYCLFTRKFHRRFHSFFQVCSISLHFKAVHNVLTNCE